MNKYGVFISYSHEDEELISPVVQLMRTMRHDRIFKDKEDIKPGKPWEIQLTNALEEAELVAVFWCEHAGKSDYVRKEYTAAIEGNKDVLPILLDDYKLSEDLSAYQWIDLRDVVVHGFNRAEIRAFMDWKQSHKNMSDTDFSHVAPYQGSPVKFNKYSRSRASTKYNISLARISFYLTAIIVVGAVVVFFGAIKTFIYEYISQIMTTIAGIVTIVSALFLYRKSSKRTLFKKLREASSLKYEMSLEIIKPVDTKSEIAAEVILDKIKEKVEAKFMNSQE